MKTALIVLPVDRPMTSATYGDMRARAFWAGSLALGLPDDRRLDVDLVNRPRAGWIVDGAFVGVMDADAMLLVRLMTEYGGVTHKQYEIGEAAVADLKVA